MADKEQLKLAIDETQNLNMRIKINGYIPKEKEPADLEKCTIDYWFAAGVRWTACLRDEEGNQVGEAIFTYHKSGVTNLKKTDFNID